MKDSLSNVPHIVICAADIDPDKIKPLLQERNDALDYLSVGEEILTDLSDSKLLDKFKREDSDKLEAALEVLKKALLGENNQFGERVKPPVTLDKMGETKAVFEKALADLSYKPREYIRTKMFHKEYGREERLEKSFEAYMRRLEEGPYRKETPKPTKVLKPVIEDPKAWNYYGVGESEKGSPKTLEEAPAEPVKEEVAPPMEGLVPVKWPKSPEMPKIKKVPTRDTNQWFSVEPAISELMNLPTGKDSTLGEGPVDDMLRILEKDIPLDEFMEKAYRLVPSYYRRTGLEERIKQLQETLASAPEAYQDKLKKALAKAEDHLKNIQSLNTNLKFLHKNWTPEMESKSSLIKNVSDNYRLTLGDREITLSTIWLEASIRFPSVSAACKKFIELNTEKEVETLFDVATLVDLEKQANSFGSRLLEDAEEKEMYLKDERNDLCEHLQGKTDDEKLSLMHGLRGEYDSFGPVAQSLVCKECWETPMNKEAADIASIVKPNTKGPSAEEEKPMVTAIVEWLNASNAQGTEEDIEKMVTDYLNEKAPDYHDENVDRVARKAFAEWKASQPIPSEVGQEGKNNMGVANADGTGVFIEPNRGNSNVQNEAPMGVRKEASVKCLMCDKVFVSGSTDYRTLKGEVCNDHNLKDITVAMTAEATQEESTMVFNTGDTALLNTRVGALVEGTEVVVTSCSEEEVSFTAGDILGITKVANLDKVAITKEAAADNEKYPWDNDGLKFKFKQGDRVRAGSVEHDGMNLKGKEGVIRDKVIMAAGEGAEQFYLVEFDGCGTATIPEEALSKAGKQPKTESALNHDEFTKESVIKPNFDAVQEFLNSYDHPPTVVTTADIEAWMADPKNNYQYSKKDLKEFIKYLQSAKVEVRVPAKKEAPDVLPDEEMAPVEELKKDAKKYKMEQTKPDGSKVTMEKEITEDMGPEFETADPTNPAIKNKWVAASIVEASCTKCSGVGSLPCDCMDSTLWLTNSCKKCNDEGASPCPSCKK